MKAAERNRAKLIEFIADPENDFPTRSEMALIVLDYKDISSLYKCFTKEEITEIEVAGLAERRKRYSKNLAKIDKAMIAEAELGNHAAAKLIYDRIEGPVDQDINVKHSGSILEDGIQISFVKAEKKEDEKD